MNDIATEADIRLLVDTFYAKVKKDTLIGYIFNTIIGEDWSRHLPVMHQFWNTVLLHNAGYTGNPVKKHVDIDKQMPLNDTHYARWLVLWEETVNELFTGEIATSAKTKANAMMQLISLKVQMAREGKSIM